MLQIFWPKICMFRPSRSNFGFLFSSTKFWFHYEHNFCNLKFLILNSVQDSTGLLWEIRSKKFDH